MISNSARQFPVSDTCYMRWVWTCSRWFFSFYSRFSGLELPEGFNESKINKNHGGPLDGAGMRSVFYPTSSPLIFLAILSVVVDQYKLQVSVCQRTKASKILDQGNHSDPGELKLIFDTQDRVQKICCPAPMVNRQGPPFSNGCFEVWRKMANPFVKNGSP